MGCRGGGTTRRGRGGSGAVTWVLLQLAVTGAPEVWGSQQGLPGDLTPADDGGWAAGRSSGVVRFGGRAGLALSGIAPEPEQSQQRVDARLSPARFRTIRRPRPFVPQTDPWTSGCPLVAPLNPRRARAALASNPERPPDVAQTPDVGAAATSNGSSSETDCAYARISVGTRFTPTCAKAAPAGPTISIKGLPVCCSRRRSSTSSIRTMASDVSLSMPLWRGFEVVML